MAQNPTFEFFDEGSTEFGILRPYVQFTEIDQSLVGDDYKINEATDLRALALFQVKVQAICPPGGPWEHCKCTPKKPPITCCGGAYFCDKPGSGTTPDGYCKIYNTYDWVCPDGTCGPKANIPGVCSNGSSANSIAIPSTEDPIEPPDPDAPPIAKESWEVIEHNEFQHEQQLKNKIIHNIIRILIKCCQNAILTQLVFVFLLLLIMS